MSAKEEQETVIVMSRVDDFAILYTSSLPMKNLWERRGYPIEQVDSHGWECKVPQKAVSFRVLDKVLNPKPRGGFRKKED